jgi:hypothetical protein
MSKEIRSMKEAQEGRCQDCKIHRNKPSRCPFYGYVGRKQTGCIDFRKK